ncbi:hypothetical protein [Azotobacter chroococcum]
MTPRQHSTGGRDRLLGIGVNAQGNRMKRVARICRGKRKPI